MDRKRNNASDDAGQDGAERRDWYHDSKLSIPFID